MNMEKYLANQSLPSYALNFDPTQKDLIRITDPPALIATEPYTLSSVLPARIP